MVEKSKSLSYLVGGLSIIVAGLIYILITDLKLLNTAQWLFIVIFFAFGSGFASILSESIKHKPVWFYIVKVIGIICAVAFIVALFKYSASVDYTLIIKEKKVTTAVAESTVNLAVLLSTIFASISILCQLANVILNSITGIDD